MDIFSFHLIHNSYGYRDSECTKSGKRDCQTFELGLFNGVGEDALVKFLVCVVCVPPHKSLSMFGPNHPPANSSWTPWLVFRISFIFGFSEVNCVG